MGWTSYRALNYRKDGTIDRRAECDAYFMEGLNRGHYRVEKSAMVGSVYYAAVTSLKKYVGNDQYEDLPENEQFTFAVVFLTIVDMKDYYNFSYKDMDESCGPFSYDCPESILKMLSPTDNEFALNWRKKCREHLQKRKTLKNAPIGTTIEFVFTGSGKFAFEGKTIQFYKHRPAYQFRKPFWFSEKYGMYIQERLIPDDYKIVG